MKYLKKVSLAVATGLVLLSGVANAASVATVSNVEGTALVDHAGQRLSLKKGMSLDEGDRVMVMEKGNLKLVYNKSKCHIGYKSNTVLNVAESMQCAAGSTMAVGAPAAAGGAGSIAGVGLGAVIAGVAVVGVIATAVSNSNDNTPVSP